MVAKKTAKTFSGYDINAISSWIDRGANLLYRWIRVRAGAECPEEISCFSESSSTIGDDTNLHYPNMLQPPELFMIRSIHSYWWPGCDPTDRADLSQYRADLRIGHKIFFTSPVVALTDIGVMMPKLPARIDPKITDLEKEMHEMIPGSLGEYPRIIQSLVPFDVMLRGKPFQAKGDIAYCLVLNGWWDKGVQ